MTAAIIVILILEACEYAFNSMEYLSNLWGREGITQNVIDRLAEAIARAKGE